MSGREQERRQANVPEHEPDKSAGKGRHEAPDADCSESKGVQALEYRV